MKNKILQEIEKNVCYTNLVYQRINKKLKTNYSKKQIENLIETIIKDEPKITRKGKNYYLYGYTYKVRVTINANNFRVITIDKLSNV